MSSSYSEALDLVKRNTDSSKEDLEDMSLDVEYLLGTVVGVAEDLEKRIDDIKKKLSSESKGLVYCMGKLKGKLTPSQWSYLERLVK